MLTHQCALAEGTQPCARKRDVSNVRLSTLMQPTRPTCSKSHIAVPALDGLAIHRCRDLIGDLDVPDFAVALRSEVGEQLRGRPFGWHRGRPLVLVKIERASMQR